MEATFSLSRHFYTKPIFAPHHKKPPVLGFHVEHGCHLQPSSPPSSALQAWPNTLKAHRTTWAVDAPPKEKGNGWDCMPSWPTQSKVIRKAWAVDSLPTPNANGGDGARAWTTAFIAMTAVAACVAGAAKGMRAIMVTPPAIAAHYVRPAGLNEVVASEELREFLDVGLKGLPKGGGDEAAEVFRQLRGARIEYPTLKKDARLAMASDQAEEIIKRLKAKFDEDMKSDGEEKALEIGLILIEMLILQGKPEDALAILKRPDFNNIIEQKGIQREGRPYLYQAAAKLLLDDPAEDITAWNRFAAAENDSPFQDGPKISFEELKKSMHRLKGRQQHPHRSRFKDFFRPFL